MKFIIFVLVVTSLGYWYYTSHPESLKQAQDFIKTTETKSKETADSGTMASLSGAGKVAKVYYVKNNNYGISATKNICMDVTSENGFGDVLAGIKKLGGAVTCMVDSNYPSKSFTITVPSLAKKGQYYCTDQNQFVGLIPNIKNEPFDSGIKCK
jgi:hypothetical protein